MKHYKITDVFYLDSKCTKKTIGYDIIYEDSNPRWKVGVIYAPNNDFKV